MRRVLDLVGIAWAPDARPLKTVLELKKIRDLIAHGKPEKLRAEVIHPLNTDAPYPTSALRDLVAPKRRLPW